LNETLAQKGVQSTDLFALNGSAPLPSGRDSSWHGLLGTPVLQEAALALAKSWRATLWIDVSAADWTNDEGGGESRFHAASVKETLGIEFAATDRIVVGARLTMGELGGDSDRIVVFQDNTQIVAQGERGFGLESALLHARWVIPTSVLNVGASVQLRIPLADEEDLLTSQTNDVAVTVLASRRWGTVTLTGNLGLVLPFGDPELFIQDDDANAYVHGGLALGWQAFPKVAFLGQLEFNTSGFSDLDALSDPVAVVLGGARVRITDKVLAHAGVGFGLTEASGDLNATAGVEVRF
jgi:hypothetical protein